MSRAAPHVRIPRRDRALLALLAAALLALLAAALLGRHELPAPGTPGADSVAGSGPVGAPAVPGAGRGPRVRYTGPRGRIAAPVVLRARARSRGARIVAVTFRIDGRVLGTDATRPYALDVPALPPGAHRLSAEAVDGLGRRTRSGGAPAQVLASAPPDIVTGPGPGFARATAALAAGHVSVRLAPGRYAGRPLTLGPGARLSGSGRATVLAAAAPAWALLTVRGGNVRVSDLALDGAGLAGRAVAVGDGSADVRLQRLRISGVRENGVEIWGAHRDVSVQDSSIDGGGAHGAGVYDLGSDRSRDTSVVRTDIRGFRAYGIDFAQRFYRRPEAALHNLALDDRIADINDPSTATGRTEGGIWSGGVAAAIIGNHVRDTGWDGIQTVGSSRGSTLVDNDIARTRTGIYLEHETTHSVIARNVIADVITGINSEWRYGGHGSSQNTYAGNRVDSPRQTGVFIDVSGDRNRIEGNVVAGGSGPGIVLQGASENAVTGNLRCGGGDAPVVRQQSAHHDDGVRADSLGNRMERNVRASVCEGP